MNKIDWSNIFKIRLASSNPSMMKHEIAKLILVMKLIYKHRRQKTWIRIYTEFELDNGLRPDIYFENIKTREVIAYEIQKDYTKAWLGRKEKQYSEWEVPLFTTDFIPIDLNNISEDINKMSEELEAYVV